MQNELKGWTDQLYKLSIESYVYKEAIMIKTKQTSETKTLVLFLFIFLFSLFLFSAEIGLADNLNQGQETLEKKSAARLKIDEIMKGEEYVGSSPSAPVWALDQKTLYFRWKKPGTDRQEIYAVSASTPVPRPVKPEEFFKNPPVAREESSGRMFGAGFMSGSMQFDPNKQKGLVIQNGDLFLIDLKSGKSQQLTAIEERKSGAKFSFDGQKVLFTMSDNLYSISLADRSIRQLTSFTRRQPPENKTPDEIEKWYSDQQKQLFKELGSGGQFGEMMSRRLPMLPSITAPLRPRPFYLKESQRIVTLELSPDEKYVIFIISEQMPGNKSTIVPNYVTRSGYTETVESHFKAAHAEQKILAGVFNTANGDVKWLDYGQGERKIYPASIFWSPDGKTGLITARADDRKDQWLLRVDLASAKTSVVFNIHDEAWVGPLGLTNIFFWPDSKHISFISEINGYAHLYKVSLDGQGRKALTEGKFEVRRASLSKDGTKIYLLTNEEHPGETHFYWMPAAGGKRVKITNLVGMNEVLISPDETTLAILHSKSNQPEELYLQLTKPGSQAIQVTRSTTEKFQSYSWLEPEIISFPARDGVEVFARLFKPAAGQSSYPAVIFIHGAGYLQNAHKGWSSYFREYMFHNLLVENGYFVLDVDYRGSSGYGRDFRAGIYRHMGGKDLNDVVDAAYFLAKNYPVDPARIGCYGGSYGGFLTLMAMFKCGDVFKAGAALRPVTDWAHYHPTYTVDILNLPQKDPEAYKQSSPIYFADSFKGALLICHGMVDTNVHFQDTVRLAQRLIELGKDNWEVALYPVENHSFVNASSWTDEYKRIFKLFELNLK